MQIKTICNHCRQPYSVNADFVGRKISCKNCSKVFEIIAIAESISSPPQQGSTVSASQPHLHPDETEFDPLALPTLDGYRSGSKPGFSSDFELVALPVDLPVAPTNETEDESKPEPEWHNKIREQAKESSFGTLERSALYLGLFGALIGLLLNFLPLIGTQFPRFQDMGVTAQVTGLFVALIGVLLIAFSLRRFKVAARAGGIGVSAFVFCVFLISVLSTQGKYDEPEPIPQEDKVTRVIESPWIKDNPSWLLGVDRSNGDETDEPAEPDDPDQNETPPDQVSLPNTALNEDQLERAKQIKNLNNKTLREMESFFGPGIQERFPESFLSPAAGTPDGEPVYIAHPSKLPIVGMKLLTKSDRSGSAIVSLAPVFDIEDADERTITAKEGFAIAGVNVNADKAIHGVQFIFMKVTPKGFDKSGSYASTWYGRSPSSGKGILLVGDGRPVYGIWFTRTKYMNSFGLIRERY